MSETNATATDTLVIVTGGFGSDKANPLARSIYSPYDGLSERQALLTPKWMGMKPFEQLYAAFEEEVRKRRERHNTERLILIGHSLGGALSTRYALDHPEQVDTVVGVAACIGRINSKIVPFDQRGKARAQIRDRLIEGVDDVDFHFIGSDSDRVVPYDSATPESSGTHYRITCESDSPTDNVVYLPQQGRNDRHIYVPLHSDVVAIVEDLALAS